ncbi:hypothetical protein HGRIS_000036 [Hohenbuehelia grisea]|uniref:Uncharacterized protein n=1 Tax=Hohenbuehelia grisea TaxID=104357 RepID=A0ABR3JQ14_9AGAR
MLKNGGADVGNFQAHYVEPFKRVVCTQTARLNAGTWQYFSILPDEANRGAMRADNDIHGLTVLRTKRGGDWKPQIGLRYDVLTSDPNNPQASTVAWYYPSLNFA